MTASIYARIAERYQVSAADDEAVERFFLDVAPTLSRGEREAIVRELCEGSDADGLQSATSAAVPTEVPSFSIDEAPPVRRTSTLAQLIGELSAKVEERVLSQLGQHPRPVDAMVVAEMAESVRNAVRRMISAKVTMTAVVENERLVGVLSEHDIVERVIAAGLNPDDTAVGDVMTKVA